MRAFLPAIVCSLALLPLLPGCSKDEPNAIPQCSILRPSPGDTIWTGSLVSVQVEASDPDGSIVGVTVYADGNMIRQLSGSGSFLWDTDGMQSGLTTLEAVAEDDAGAEGKASISILFMQNGAPTAAFLIQPGAQDYHLPFSFDASASSDDLDSLGSLTFRWDWEDDGLFDTPWSNATDATHTYPLPGNYTVRLEVRDSEGLTSSATRTLEAQGQPPQPPVAAFSVQPASGSISTAFIANAAASYDPDGPAGSLSYRWDWNGDGSYDTPWQSDTIGIQNYIDPGIYTIILQIKDADQLTDTATAKVTVTAGGPGEQPCPGIPTVTYQGMLYHTLLIGSRCWLKENLNAGTFVSSASGQGNNGATEKYCYNDLPSNCVAYGGLYTWDEAMKYASLPQGICPLGWHVATDEDFINLEGSLDTQYDTLASIWDSTGFRGLDAGLRLRSATGWLSGGNGTDVAGFSAEPGGGAFGSTASFNSLGTAAMFWTSTTESTGASYGRYLEATSDQVYRGGFQRVNAFSVRCVKD